MLASAITPVYDASGAPGNFDDEAPSENLYRMHSIYYQVYRTGPQRIVQKAKSVLPKLSHATNGTNHTTMSLVRIEYILLLVMLFAFCTALFLR